MKNSAAASYLANTAHSSLIQTITVGSGIHQMMSPNQPPKRVADYTAGGDSHPAPKNKS